VDWTQLAAWAILAIGTIAIYSRTLHDPLLLDDFNSIGGNPSIRRLWPLWQALSPPNGAGVGGRPLLNLSYALNYAFGGTGVFGYHLVNLIVHVLAALTLFGLVRRTLLRPALAERFGSSATFLALAASAIWAWHPLQTESVTYLSQRAESLMGLFYLLTVYCFVRGVEPDCKLGRRGWFSLSVLACLAGVGTKEVIVTAPLLVLIYDRTFVSASFSRAWLRHWPLYLALTATWVPLGCLMADLRGRFVGFGFGIHWWAYAFTECRVIVRYILLAVWPHPLLFDYGPYAATPLSELWPYALILASLVTATVFALRRWPAASFAASWFVLILAPTSSIVPIMGQPMAENRLYLPLAGVAGLVALGAFRLVGRRALPALAVVAVALGLASVQRNQDYVSEQAIWRDTVAKDPDNARAHNNLAGAILRNQGRLDDAVAQCEEALRLKPDLAEAHGNLGDVLIRMPGRLNDAIVQYEEALRLKPDLAEAHNNLGYALVRVPGRLDDAIAQYREALRLNPDYAKAHDNLGAALERVPGRLGEAAAQIEEGLRQDPNYAEAHNDLGAALAGMPGRLTDAIAQYKEALRLEPGLAEAHYNLGNALSAEGKTLEAIDQYEEALREEPGFAEAHSNLGAALEKMPGRLEEAIAQYKEALRLKPDYAAIHLNLALALIRLTGHNEEARANLDEVLRLQPDNDRARQILAAIPATHP
jgi:tetratricopeptide (TPR) repeat protein